MSGDSRWPARVMLVAAFGLAGASAVDAQIPPFGSNQLCPPDGLTGACCQAATPNLPNPTPMKSASAQLVCFKGCTVGGTQQLGAISLVNIAPTPNCGVFTANVVGPFVADVKLHYTRHWQQVQPGLGIVAVYRYVVVGRLVNRGAWSCTLEPVPFEPFLYGYVDLVYRKGCKPVAMALVLGHNCDDFIHNTSSGCTIPTLNPGGGHPGEASVVVAPGANFVANPSLVPPQGPAFPGSQGAVRRLNPACQVNDGFAAVGLNNLPAFCACGAGVLAPQYTPQELKGTTACGATLMPASLCPYNLAPPTHTLFTWSIGRWVLGPYPGRPGGYRAWLTEGYVLYLPGAATCEPPREAVWYGAETTWGLAAFERRVDLVDNYNPANNGPIIGGPGAFQTRVMFVY